MKEIESKKFINDPDMDVIQSKYRLSIVNILRCECRVQIMKLCLKKYYMSLI